MKTPNVQPKFTSRLGFIAAAAGSAVGLGNIWKFPYEVGTHGGASFLFIYLICITLLGYPIVVAELAFGKAMQNDTEGITTSAKKWTLCLTLSTTLSLMMMMSLYHTISGWVFGYLIATLNGTLLSTDNPAIFFKNFVQNTPYAIGYSLPPLLAAALIILNDVKQGIERWAKRLIPLFLLLLLGLILYAFTLENAWEGIQFYLIPHWDAITLEVILSALAHCFFSLSVGIGVMITYGSYMRKEDSIAQAAALITLSDTLVAFLAGLFLFPFIFSQHMQPSQGCQLAFVTLPAIFQSLGYVLGNTMGSMFFLLLAFAALTSSISALEGMAAYLTRNYGLKRKAAVYWVVVATYLPALPTLLSCGGSTFFTNFWCYNGTTYSFMDLVDKALSIALPSTCFVFTLFLASHPKKLALLLSAIGIQKHTILARYLRWMLAYGCPLLLGTILCYSCYSLVK